jgi:RNA 3'-terminal phosphate cyclase (ATP)
VAGRRARDGRPLGEDDGASAGVPIGLHLADQLLLPLALAGGGAFRTMPLSLHATTNAEVIRCFIDVSVDVAPVTDSAVDVTVRR